MKSSELLAAFDDWGELHELRDTTALDEILSALPSDPAAYVEAVRDMLDGLTPQIYEGWKEEINVYSRFEGILRELFYADERTLEALLWIVEWASAGATSGLRDFGINPLAALTSQLHRRPLPRTDESALLGTLERWARHSELHHNATECGKRILKRLRPQ